MDQKNLFKPFFKSEDPQSKIKNTGGHGLGLSICFKIVKGLGGTIHVQSDVGMGTKFTVELTVENAEYNLKYS